MESMWGNDNSDFSKNIFDLKIEMATVEQTTFEFCDNVNGSQQSSSSQVLIQ